jgi:selenocysteine-specific elongation factor
VKLEIEEMVEGSFLEGRPIVPVSSTTGAGLDALRAALLESVAAVEDRDATTRVFRLPIDRVFSMKGFGSVITGTTWSGQVPVESEVEVLPAGLRSRARAIQVHGETREAATAGERTSMNLPDIALDELHRGNQVVSPGTLRPSQIITVRLDLLPDSKPLKEQTRIRFHHLASELLGTLRFVDGTKGELAAGQSAWAQVRLESPIVAVSGDRFVIRRYSPAVTIGGGFIVDPHLPKMSRGTRPELFETLAHGTLQQRVELMAKLAGASGISIEEIQARTGITTKALTRELKTLPHLSPIAAGRWIHNDILTDYRRRAIAFLEEYFRTNKMTVAVPKGEFVQKILPRGSDAALTNFLLADLANEKIVAINGDNLDIPGRSKTLGGAEGELARQIEAFFRDAGLQTPAVSTLIKTINQRPRVIEGVIFFLVKQGTLLRVNEGVYLHRAVVDEAKEKMSTRKGETLDVAQFKDFFGLSRKIAIPLLELFDREGVTKRVGDTRIVL